MLDFPRGLLREQSLQWGLYHRTIDNGPTISLQTTAVNATGGGLWRAKLTSVAIHTADLELLWDAIDAQMDGGATPVNLPFCKGVRARPWPLDASGHSITRYPIPHSDGAFFSDGTGYDQPVIDAHAGTAAALRATSLDIAMGYGGVLRPGMHFAIDHPNKGWHLYRIADVTVYVPGANQSGTYTVSIRPPLREAVALGAFLEFEHPRCRMMISTPDDMALDLAYRKNAAPTVGFVEVA